MIIIYFFLLVPWLPFLNKLYLWQILKQDVCSVEIIILDRGGLIWNHLFPYRYRKNILRGDSYLKKLGNVWKFGKTFPKVLLHLLKGKTICRWKGIGREIPPKDQRCLGICYCTSLLWWASSLENKQLEVKYSLAAALSPRNSNSSREERKRLRRQFSVGWQ